MKKLDDFAVQAKHLQRWAKPRRTHHIGQVSQVMDTAATKPAAAVASRSGRLDTIDRAMDIQQILFEISQITNKYYSFQMLVMIATAFIVIVFDLYNMLDMLTNRHTKSEFQCIY